MAEYKERGGYYDPIYSKIILALNVVLTIVMGKRFVDTEYKIMPAGMVFFLAVAATWWYFNRLILNPLDNMKSASETKSKKKK